MLKCDIISVIINRRTIPYLQLHSSFLEEITKVTGPINCCTRIGLIS